MLEKKLHEELMRFNAINRYSKNMITEQDLPPADPNAPMDPNMPPPPMDAPPMEVPPMDTSASDSTEEIDITDLVNMTKSIKKDIESKKTENDNVNNKMDDVFSKLTELEGKLSQMDQLMSKIDQLGSKVETMKEPNAQEKLEMRSLDSYPFSQNPQQFFAMKQDDMRKAGKNEYVLTKHDIESYPRESIIKTFNPLEQDDEFRF